MPHESPVDLAKLALTIPDFNSMKIVTPSPAEILEKKRVADELVAAAVEQILNPDETYTLGDVLEEWNAIKKDMAASLLNEWCSSEPSLVPQVLPIGNNHPAVVDGEDGYSSS